ncbi:alpha/beta hydrolase [Bifidobacterium gallicum]|nr:alpha/beta hydrolase [Bifidobacterium gallicum]KFI59525.1 carboxylesterase [Bifidobacterium gallicum DSM 20093 = LMG 11596]
MPINKAIYAAISHLMPNAKHTYRLQRVMEDVGAKMERGLAHICDSQDISITLNDGYDLQLRVFTPLISKNEYRWSQDLQADKKTLKENAKKLKEARKIRLREDEEALRIDEAQAKDEHKHGETLEARESDNEAKILRDVIAMERAGQPIDLQGTILFMHGGGWATGSAELYTDACANLALQTQRRVISIDYRRAPDHRYPTPVEDCYQAAVALYQGTMPIPAVPDHPEVSQHIDPDDIVLFGDSAGGNLAVAITLMGRDRGTFQVKQLMALYPCLNNDYNPATSPYDSVRENGRDYLLTARDMMDYLEMYRSNIPDLLDPYFAPLNEQHLEHMPRTLIISAEYCPLRDEDEHFAHLLQDAGNDVQCYRMRDGVHGYFLYPRISPLVSRTYKVIDHFLDGVPFSTMETDKEAKASAKQAAKEEAQQAREAAKQAAQQEAELIERAEGAAIIGTATGATAGVNEAGVNEAGITQADLTKTGATSRDVTDAIESAVRATTASGVTPADTTEGIDATDESAASHAKEQDQEWQIILGTD